MNQKQIGALTMLRGVQRYMNETADSHPILANAGVARRRLDDVIANLTTHIEEQEAASLAMRGATAHQRACRVKLLLHHMAPINRIATSDLDAYMRTPFRMPRGNPSVNALACDAQGMARSAAAHIADFIAAGLPLDCIDRLERAAERLLATIGERATAGMQRARSGDRIHALLSEGRGLVRVIDAFVTAACSGNPGALARWKAARRVHIPTPTLA